MVKFKVLGKQREVRSTTGEIYILMPGKIVQPRSDIDLAFFNSLPFLEKIIEPGVVEPPQEKQNEPEKALIDGLEQLNNDTLDRVPSRRGRPKK